MRVWVSPRGSRFAYPAHAVLDVFRTRADLSQFYKDYAPHTTRWLFSLESQGRVERPTHFDPFLITILRRAGYREAYDV